MALAFLLGFLLGALALAALEAAAALILVRRLRRKQAAAADAPPADELPGERPFPYEKQVEWDANSCCACPCFPFDSIRFDSIRSPSFRPFWLGTDCLPACHRSSNCHCRTDRLPTFAACPRQMLRLYM